MVISKIVVFYNFVKASHKRPRFIELHISIGTQATIYTVLELISKYVILIRKC